MLNDNPGSSASELSVAAPTRKSHPKCLNGLSAFLAKDHGPESLNAFSGHGSDGAEQAQHSAGRDERASGRRLSESVKARTSDAERSGSAGAVVSAAAAAALDTSRNKCLATFETPTIELTQSGHAAVSRAVRYRARSVLWRASTLKSVRCCGYQARESGEPDTAVGIRHRVMEDGRVVAGYAGLQQCGSVWSCPRCSAVIAQRRVEEMKRALNAAVERDCEVYMLTFTVSHSKKDGLESLFDGLQTGWRSAFGSSAWSGTKERVRERHGKTVIVPAIEGDADRIGFVGRIRTTEATRSITANGAGWHLHYHVLLITERGGMAGVVRSDVDELFASWGYQGPAVDRRELGMHVMGHRLMTRWQKGVEKKGFKASFAGFDIRPMQEGTEEFLSSYLTKSTFDVTGRLAAEMSLSSGKEARTERNVPPFQLLDMCATDLDVKNWGIRTPRHWTVEELDGDLCIVDSDTGELTAVTPPGLWRLWVEWEQSSKGRRQMLWSQARGDTARAVMWREILDARGEEHTDEEIAAEELVGTRLGEIPEASWMKLVRHPEWVTGALEATEQGGLDAVVFYLAERGIEFVPAPPETTGDESPPTETSANYGYGPRLRDVSVV